jgi:hypothetical protein
MRQLFIVLPLVMVPVWMAYCQGPDLGRTGLFINGRYWKILPEVAKTAYLTGLMEAVSQLGGENPPSCRTISGEICRLDAALSLSGSFSSNATVGEAVDEVDAFYHEPANLRIPVLAAMRYTFMKMRGSSKSTLEACEAELRKGAVEPSPLTKCSSR